MSVRATSWCGESDGEHDYHTVNNVLAFVPNRTLELTNVFVQDSITLNEELKLTAGMKFEENVYSDGAPCPTCGCHGRRTMPRAVAGGLARHSRAHAVRYRRAGIRGWPAVPARRSRISIPRRSPHSNSASAARPTPRCRFRPASSTTSMTNCEPWRSPRWRCCRCAGAISWKAARMVRSLGQHPAYALVATLAGIPLPAQAPGVQRGLVGASWACARRATIPRRVTTSNRRWTCAASPSMRC